ncbi:MAG: hypothetical protein DSY90_09770 [Deltaproteobacteria bacterium]|nr:MAG: hypothetical protein DSY90_09770 [Deltaproteobacteria bacterium]
MQKKLSGLVFYLIVAGLLCIGSGIVYYAFELVGIPDVRQYNESLYVIVGSVLAICGAGMGVYRYRSARQAADER